MNKKAVILGYFGRGNYGDEIMLQEFIKVYTQSEVALNIIVSGSTNYKQSKDIKYVDSSDRWSRLVLYFKSNTFIWCGGTCLYSNRGLYSLFFNTILSKLFGNKIIFYGIGIGEISNSFDKLLIRFILRISNLIYFRDISSFDKANHIFKSDNYKIIPDLVNLYDLSKETKTKTNLIINLTKDFDFKYFELLIGFIKKYEKEVKEIVLLPAEIGCDGDILTLAKVLDNYKDEFPSMRLSNPKSVSDITEEILNAKFYIGMRLHILFICDSLNIPSIAIEYSPKISYYNDEVGGSPNRIVSINEKINSDLIRFEDVKEIDKIINKNKKILINSIKKI